MTELMCLATAIFFEARGEPHTGQEMVAEVVMNRVEHKRFPDTVCGVVVQPNAFSFIGDHLSDNMSDYSKPLDVKMQYKSLTLAQNYLDGYRLGITSTHYHADYVDPFWADHFEPDGSFGSHIFYTCSGFC